MHKYCLSDSLSINYIGCVLPHTTFTQVSPPCSEKHIRIKSRRYGAYGESYIWTTKKKEP
jgi:hypothetical protein